MARILIVDDDPDTTDSCAQLLGLWGHETRKVYEGTSVPQDALVFDPDVILLDIGMPRMNGHSVARQLREHEQLNHAKLVAISGFAMKPDIRLCEEAGFDQFFAKPVEMEVLKDFLEAMEASLLASSHV